MPPPPPVLIRLDGMLTKIKSNIYALHNLDLPPLFKGRQLILITSPPLGGEGLWKILKRGWKYGAGAGLLKRGGWNFSYLIFSRFIIFTFRNYFTLCKIVLCIWRKIIFFCHHNFMNKGYSKLSKNEPENIP